MNLLCDEWTGTAPGCSAGIPSFFVEWAPDASAALVQHVSVDLRRLNARMPQKFLYGADVVAGLDHVRGEGVAEGVTNSRASPPRPP
jgi:hypothetical protein